MPVVNQPKFKETLWEWRAFSSILDSNISRDILSLPKIHDKPGEILDHYLCVNRCNHINIKIRLKNLRIKKIRKKGQMGIEEWTTEAYTFPIPTTIFKTISKALGLEDLQESAMSTIKDAEDLISVLSENCVSTTSTFRVITVQKQRELYVWSSKDNDGVTIELAEIKTPEKITSIGIENHNIRKVVQAIKYLKLPSPSMRVLNYVDCLRLWAHSKSLF